MMVPALVLCTLLFASLCSANILFIDSSAKSYLQPSSDGPVKLQTEALSSVITALSGMFPAYAVDQAASQAIGQLVKPSPLKKPRAYVVINVAGLSSDEALGLFANKQHRAVNVQGCVATAQASAVAAITDANPDMDVVVLDQQALQACKNNCIDEHLPAAAESFGAKHAGSVLTFASGANLDLGKLSDKLFAVEVAALWGGLKEQLQQHAQADQQQQDVQVYELTLLGLQGLSATYGPGSKELLAAQEAVKSLLQSSVKALDDAFAGDLVYQVAAFDAVPVKGGVESIMEWKQASRRHLAQTNDTASVNATAVWPPADEVAAAKSFTAKACAYGGFVLLVYFTMGAIWCMCNMPMQVDTLLFGSKKTE